jgi:hypothetical protein
MRKIYLSGYKLFFNNFTLLLFNKVLIISFFTLVLSNRVLADYTITTGTSVNASTITGQSGVLTINGTLYVDQGTVSLLGFTSVIINGPNGQIYWNGNYDLKFSAGISFDINNPTLGLQPTSGNGNASTRLYIGSTIIAVQSDNSNNAPFSFEEFNAAGGLPKFTLTASPTSLGNVCYGNTFTATIKPVDNIVSFDCDWAVDNGGSISPASVSGFTAAQNATIAPKTSATAITYTVTCTLYRAGDDDVLTSKTVTVTVNKVNALPTDFSMSGGGSYCSGGSGVAITLAGSQSGVNYQLYNGASTVGSAVAGTGSSISFGNQVTAGTYTVVATNASTSCTKNMTGSVAVTVNTLPTAFSISGGGSYCSGGSGVPITLAGSQSGVNYQLYNGASTVGGAVAGTGSSISFGNQATAGTYTVMATNATTSCTRNMTGSVAVNALPTAFSISGGGSYCLGGSGVSITLTGSQSGVNYQLYNGASTVGNAVAGTGSSISFGNQATAGTYAVVATNATTSCTKNMTGSVTVTVNTLPTAFSVSGGGSYCLGGSGVSITLTGSQSGVNYQLYNGASTVGSAVAGTGSSISFGNQATAGIYTVVATNATTSCTKDMSGSATVGINLRPTSVIETTTPNICNGSSAVISVTLTGTAPWTLTYFDGTVSTVISGIVTSPYIFNVSPVSSKTYTITTLRDAICTSISSDLTGSATVDLNNVWTGVTSSDWFTPSNWSGGQLPAASCPSITIPQVISPNVYPVISAGTAVVNNLFIDANASLTVSEGTIQISGSVSNSGIFNATNGAVEFNGSSAQSIPANLFYTNKIKDLVISNNVSLDGVDSLTGNLSFGSSSNTFTTNGNLILKSTAAYTASVGQIINANSISGEVTVERFISAKRAWRFLAIPTNTTQTFHQAWQEDQPQNVVGLLGYGTQITHNTSNWAANGFDNYSGEGPSVKTWNSASNSYAGISNTNLGIATKEGLMTFVRGDRTSVGLNATPTTTVLRTKGTLKQGDQATISVPAGKLISLGNPYASAIDMRTIAKTAGKNYTFYLYDPNINTLGAFQTFLLNADGNYYAVPGSSTPHNYIQSGQAFFIASDGGDITIKESSKTGVSGPLMFRSLQATPSLRTNLYVLDANSNASLVDGVLNSFGENFSSALDGKDSRKVMNFSENLGIKVQDQLLAIEKRNMISKEDTIFLSMTKMKVKSYQFEIIGENFDEPGLTAFLEDSYLNTSTPIDINGTTTIKFNVVDVSGSWNPGRFKVVFKQAAALPVIFTSVKAYEQNKNIAVEWKVENEVNMKQYDVEKSTDGQHFTKLVTITEVQNNNNVVNYSWTDMNAVTGNNSYRIKSVSVNGEVHYSATVKVIINSKASKITVYPNPVVDGTINLQMMNQSKGGYAIKLINNLGQVIVVKQIEHEDGSSIETIQINKSVSKGNYHLEIVTPDKGKVTTKLLVR